MTREQVRVLVPAILSVVLIAAGTLVFDWFVVQITGADIVSITMDLREARACSIGGTCGAVPVSMMKGSFYPTFAAISFWAGLVFAVLVLFHVGTRMMNDAGNESLRKASHGLGTLVVLTSVGAGFISGPDLEPAQLLGLGIDVDRGWGPLAMLAGLMAGHLALYYTREGTIDDAPLVTVTTPTLPRAVAQTRVPLPMSTPPAGLPEVKPRSKPQSKPPVVARTQTPTTPAPLRALAERFKGKIRFAMVTGDVTVAGIDARREDHSTVLVMWRDIVGLVARRLPPELEGHPFVDIVSTAGMTLRVLPWSKLTGEPVDGEGDARMRRLLRTVKARCADAKVDRATQAFLDDETKSPAQLPSPELLAKHDQALA